jgi:hypothetical protein
MGPQANSTEKKAESSLQNCLEVTEAVKEAESSLCIYSNESNAEKEAGLIQNSGQEWDLL